MTVLVLEIEFLAGISFAAIGPDSATPDWPPQPDRIFSALVATWAARGQRQQEANALEWLERLSVPRVLASEFEPRTAPIVFVPPNDPRSDKQKTARGVFPALRSRQSRRFPAARPHDRVIQLLWEGVRPDEETLAALTRLASDTAYIGHSSSLTRCRFVLRTDGHGLLDARLPERWVYTGRLVELRRRFDSGLRPLNGVRVRQAPEPRLEPRSVFSARWLLLEHVGGDMPDVRACALVAKAIRDALLSGYQRIGLGDQIPGDISGHAPDGSPIRSPHLAIAPLPFAGFPYADGHVMGFALIPPQDSPILDDEGFRSVVRALAPIDAERGRRVLTVTTRRGTSSDRAFSIDLAVTFEGTGRSLEPFLYTRPAQNFATVTPIVLDRHLKEVGAQRQDEIAEQIAGACRNAGLPDPQQIVADKHPAFVGMPSAYPSGKSPDWMRWRLPQSSASRQLTHAAIHFAAPVAGPVLLGAGRFVGLGLCRPLDPEER